MKRDKTKVIEDEKKSIDDFYDSSDPRGMSTSEYNEYIRWKETK